MDLIYVFTSTVCCYRYDPELRARTQFIKDRRIYPSYWTRSERRHYKEERIRNVQNYNYHLYHNPWMSAVFEEIRAREPEKTLVEMRENGIASIIGDFIRTDYYGKRGDRLLCLSFFHNDEDTANLMWQCTPEQLLEEKAAWISWFLNYSFIKLVEIPHDFTLTEDYMRGLFEEHVLNAEN